MNTKASARKKIVPNDRLREERERRNWTHKQVADQIDLPDPHTASRWERSFSFPSARYRQELCRIFEKQPEELDLLRRSAHEDGDAKGVEQEESIYNLPTFFSSLVGRRPDIIDALPVLADLH